MEQLTDQQVFDRVAKHLLTQNEVSEAGKRCQYRGGVGRNVKQLKCAIGCLIPDEVYDPAFEGKTVAQLPSSVIAAAGLATANERLLIRLQVVHDMKDVTIWKDRLRDVAMQFQLSAAVLSQF